MPFAQATFSSYIPFDSRFGLPQTPSTLTGVQSATTYGTACPQLAFQLDDIPLDMTPTKRRKRQSLEESEDCLFINVIRPGGTAANANLPVLFWIFGGGFEEGDTSEYDGTYLVTRSVQLNEPMIYVSANYRLNAFGFLASSEVQAAGVGNLGLRDQRFALEWVQSNIALFGGDASKNVSWGQSAGSVSVGLQLVINGGNPAGLFQAAFMESGTPVPLTPLSSGQQWYNQLVSATGCSSASNTLACLTTVPSNLRQLVWRPGIDGSLITEDPMVSVANGNYAKVTEQGFWAFQLLTFLFQVPFIAGDVDDEGTTNAEATNYMPSATTSEFEPLTILYPNDQTQSGVQTVGRFPRRLSTTGTELWDDRRYFMKIASTTQDAWGYCTFSDLDVLNLYNKFENKIILVYKRGKNESCLGSAHGHEVPEFYGMEGSDNQGSDAIINFVNTFNPNTVTGNSGISSLISWPQYGTDLIAPPLLTFTDPDGLSITTDTYRVAGMQTFMNLFSFYDV
ncbi:hypothetical protein Clacol_004229 [Clathrus columnatus]|uniref:Carboxylesterase type B domain-containing protein n=1 Tax=Clathrus columnatus TaxID=1419009 RepID=A0AAV5ABJ4_9AGAM|nr:hypothetical protein Clacol_004229 [Clathrus columnatus]